MRDYKYGFYPFSLNQGWIILSITTSLTFFMFLFQEPVYTGIPTRDKTSETTVRNLYWIFDYTHDSLQP